MRKATNKNWQRVTAAAAALALCAGVLTGCGASSSTAAGSAAASSAAASEVSSEEADEMAAKNVADLIDAIYVQERNENTDAQCEAAKAAWDALTDADMQRLDSCGHCQASYVKLHFDEHKAFTSLYFMELHLTLPQLQDAARALFADPACGHILRIKGFLQTVDGWCELNATRDTMHVEPIPDGQEVLIIIGEELDRSAIEAHIGQKTADQE